MNTGILSGLHLGVRFFWTVWAVWELKPFLLLDIYLILPRVLPLTSGKAFQVLLMLPSPQGWLSHLWQAAVVFLGAAVLYIWSQNTDTQGLYERQADQELT